MTKFLGNSAVKLFAQKRRNFLFFSEIEKLLDVESKQGRIKEILDEAKNNVNSQQKKTVNQAMNLIDDPEVYQKIDKEFNTVEVQRVREYLLNPDTIQQIAAEEAALTKGKPLSPAEQEKALQARLGVRDSVWKYLRQKLKFEFTDFRQKVDKAAETDSTDSNTVLEKFKTVFRQEKIGKSFEKFADFLAYWQEQPEMKSLLDEAKGEQKKSLLQEFEALAKELFEKESGTENVDELDTTLKELTKNGQPLEKVLWESPARTPEELWNALNDNYNNLPQDLQKFLLNADKKSAEKFQRKHLEKLAARYEKRTKKMEEREGKLENVATKIAETLSKKANFDRMTESTLKELIKDDPGKAIPLNKLPEYIATPFSERLRAATINKAFALQVDVKQQKSKEVLDTLTKEIKAGKHKGNMKTMGDLADSRFRELRLFKNLPDAFREKMDTKLKEQCETFQKNIDNYVDKVDRSEMAGAWESYMQDLKSFKRDFDSPADFTAQFVSTYFEKNLKEARKYLADHPNFAKAVEQRFKQYEKEQGKKFSADFSATINVISDAKMRKGMEKSFANASSNKQRRGWQAYAEKHAGQYETSLQSSRKLEESIDQKISSISDPKEAKKIRGKFAALRKSFESHKGTYDSAFVSPRDYESQLHVFLGEISVETVERTETMSVSQRERIAQMDLSELDFRNPLLKNKQNFYRALGWKEKVWMSEAAWKGDGSEAFYAKADELFDQARVVFKSVGQLERKVNGLSTRDLDAAGEFSDINAFIGQPALREFFENLGVSDVAYDTVSASVVKPQLTRLYAEHLRNQKSAENVSESPAVKQAKKVINNVSIYDLDLTKDFANPDTFGLQPALHDDIYFDEAVFEQVAAYFDIKNMELYAEHQEVRSDMQRLEKAVGALQLSELKTNFTSFDDFAKQPKLRALFRDVGASDLAYDAIKNDVFRPKMRELWGQTGQETEKSADFSTEALQDLSGKHGLRFTHVRLKSHENLPTKFDRMDQLLGRSNSMRNLFRQRENELAPFFLEIMGELNTTDFSRLLTDVGTKSYSEGELLSRIFDDPRRRFLAKEAKKHNFDSWCRLKEGEKKLKETKISDILENKHLVEETVEEENLEPTGEQTILDLPMEAEIEPVIETEEESVEAEPVELKTEVAEEVLVEPEEEILEVEEREEVSEEVDEIVEPEEDLAEELPIEAETDEEALTEDEPEPLPEIVDTEPETAEEEVGEVDAIVEQLEPEESDEKSAEKLVEHSESGDETSLPENWEEGFEQGDDQTSAHFAETYLRDGMRLGELLERVENYLTFSLVAPPTFQHALTAADKRIYLKNPRNFFTQVVNFIEQDTEIANVHFSVQEKELLCRVEKVFGMRQGMFGV